MSNQARKASKINPEIIRNFGVVIVFSAGNIY